MNYSIKRDYLELHMSEKGIKSINQLARLIGISESLLCRILKGDRNPGQSTIGKMIDYFQAPFETIFERTVNDKKKRHHL
mgnify:CR=1 FL=1